MIFPDCEKASELKTQPLCTQPFDCGNLFWAGERISLGPITDPSPPAHPNSDRHNRKFGYIGRTNGSKLNLVIPHPPTGTAPLVAFISYLKSYDNMGEAHITCIQGCSCKYTKLQGSWTTQASVSHLKPIELSIFEVGSSCTMQIQHMGGVDATAKFKLSGLMLAQQDNLMNAAHRGVFGHYAADR